MITDDFNKKTIAALVRNGIYIIGLQAIPDMESSMPYANAIRGYLVNDNGTGRVWTNSQILAAAK